MKKLQSKSLLTLVVILGVIGIITTSSSRSGVREYNATKDSTENVLNNAQGAYVISNPNRVRYPEILREHRAESKEYIAKYVKKERSYIKLMFDRGAEFMQVARGIFEEMGIPREFQVLPALESNFFKHAVSPAGAVGYWQFMPELAREYGLKVGGANDERKNFHKSTVAAAKFIRNQLKAFNDDVLLVVASYNCGPGRVSYAIKKSGEADYWQLKQYLPAETRRFVMNFLALNVVEMNYSKFLASKLDFNQPSTVLVAGNDSTNYEVLNPFPKL